MQLEVVIDGLADVRTGRVKLCRVEMGEACFKSVYNRTDQVWIRVVRLVLRYSSGLRRLLFPLPGCARPEADHRDLLVGVGDWKGVCCRRCHLTGMQCLAVRGQIVSLRYSGSTVPLPHSFWTDTEPALYIVADEPRSVAAMTTAR